MKARTTGAIKLTPTGNAQGGYNFLSLATGRKLSRQQWDALPMPDGGIAALERLAEAKEQPIIGQGAPIFEWAPGIPIADDVEEPIVGNDDIHNVDDDNVPAGKNEGADMIPGDDTATGNNSDDKGSDTSDDFDTDDNNLPTEADQGAPDNDEGALEDKHIDSQRSVDNIDPDGGELLVVG
jgi:hypothetical protein